MWNFVIDILHRLLYCNYVYGVKERYYTRYTTPKNSKQFEKILQYSLQ